MEKFFNYLKNIFECLNEFFQKNRNLGVPLPFNVKGYMLVNRSYLHKDSYNANVKSKDVGTYRIVRANLPFVMKVHNPLPYRISKTYFYL